MELICIFAMFIQKNHINYYIMELKPELTQRKPEWLKISLPQGKEYLNVREVIVRKKLHTICVSGKCPNMAECWGRGTATFDGMALAQSIIEYIHTSIGCKTLFSTHYHELTDLENTLKSLKNIHVSAKEEDGNITFLHKIKEGSIDKSYGIHVAKLANLPEKLIKRASEILNIYENKEKQRDIKIQESLPLDELIEQTPSEVEEELKKINPLEVSPMEALNILYELKNKIK